MIDTHTHLFDPRFAQDLDATIERAKAAGIDRFILPATDDDAHTLMFDTVREYPDCCYATMGLHPTCVNDNSHWREHLANVRRYLENPPMRFVAIGETGLDLHWSKDFLTEQIEAFRTQIELSIEFDLPLIIHTRDAWDELLPIMEQYAGRIRGVFHSFAGELCHVERCERLGGFVYGINGTVTYKKSTLPDVLEHITLEKIILETDSPYLPPEPYRGKRNESAYVAILAAKVAQIKGITTAELDRVTTATAEKLFSL